MTETHDPVMVAEDAVAAGDPVAVPTLAGLVDGVAATLRQGSAVGRACVGLTAEMVRISLGRSSVAPAQSDWRFKDPTWSENPVYRRMAQAYLSSCRAVDDILDGVDRSSSWQRSARARFALGILPTAMAPTNTLVGNPGALKKTFEAGGTNLLRGAGHFVSDLRHNGGMPSMAKPGALKVGEDLALTPGFVVERDEYAELLQYTPSTTTVYQRPVLVVPPPIGRFYFLDLRPGRSFVEYSVSRGLQTFLLSWRNPSAQQADWDIDTYAQRILDAVETVRGVTGAPDVNVIGFCAGGILQTAVLKSWPRRATTGSTQRRMPSRCLTSDSRRPLAPSPRRRCSRWRAGTQGGTASSAPATWETPSRGCVPTTWCGTTG
jgi:polyhydroxyalkanoate synthase